MKIFGLFSLVLIMISTSFASDPMFGLEHDTVVQATVCENGMCAIPQATSKVIYGLPSVGPVQAFRQARAARVLRNTSESIATVTNDCVSCQMAAPVVQSTCTTCVAQTSYETRTIKVPTTVYVEQEVQVPVQTYVPMQTTVVAQPVYNTCASYQQTNTCQTNACQTGYSQTGAILGRRSNNLDDYWRYARDTHIQWRNSGLGSPAFHDEWVDVYNRALAGENGRRRLFPIFRR